MRAVHRRLECIAVDWSGAVTGAAARIWVARAVDGQLLELTAPGSREAVQQLLLARCADPAPVLVGLDFAFGFPAWFALERGWTHITHAWAAARDEGEQWLQRGAPPFWGRPGITRPHDAARGLRACERELGTTPKSVFQVGGAGAVGTGSLRGMPMLLALREAGWAVWPFDAPHSHTLTEIYPRMFTGAVVKRSAEARRAHVARVLDAGAVHIDAAARAAMCASEDAFDAALSALGMTRGAVQQQLQAPRTPLDAIEGRILGPVSAR